MNKRLISLLLVAMMIFSLLPMTVLASDTDKGDNEPEKADETVESVDVFSAFMEAMKNVLFTYDENRLTDEEVALGVSEKDNTGAVAVPVFGKELSDIAREGNLFQYTKEALQVRLSGKSVIPVSEVTLTGDPNDEDTKNIKQTLKEADYSAFHGLGIRVDANIDFRQFAKAIISDCYDMGDDFIPFFSEMIDFFKIDTTEQGIESMIDNVDKNDFSEMLLVLLGTGSLRVKTAVVTNSAVFKVFAGVSELFGIDLQKKLKEFINKNYPDATIEDDYIVIKGDWAEGLKMSLDDCTQGIEHFCNAIVDQKAEPAIEKMIKDVVDKLINNELSKYAGFAYRSYVATGLPEGKYHVKVTMMDRQGFVTAEPNAEAEISREFDVTVNAGEVAYAGDKFSISNSDEYGNKVDLEKLLTIEEDVQQLENKNNNTFITQINNALSMVGEVKELFNNAVSTMNQLKEKIINYQLENPVTHNPIPSPLTVALAFSLTGAWADWDDPSIDFTNQDLGGNMITSAKTSGKQAQFIMIDRDKLIELMEAMIGVGKDTFENVLASLKDIYGNESDITTWDEFVKLHQELVTMKQEESDSLPQISIDPKTAFDLVKIYVKMMDIPEVWYNFLEKDVRLPAMLKTTADEKGNVSFTEDSNITLVWMLDVLVKMADLSQDAVKEIGDALREEGTIEQVVDAAFEGAEFENEALKGLLVQILEKLVEITEKGADAAFEIIKGTAEPVKGIVNEWIYPILQNDQLFQAMYVLIDPNHKDLAHGILTDKMPDGYYLMFQKTAPEGYIINPMVYTVKLDWDEYGWLYAEIANLGIIGPYLAEDYYTFFRNNSIAGTTDRILNLLTNNKSDNIIAKIIDRKYDVTSDAISASATMIAAQTWLIYNFMGGRLVYSGDDGQAKLQADLTAYLKAKGQTAENLASFGHDVYARSKAVVSADLTDNSWAFYNASKSIKENIVVQATAIMKGISGSIVTDGSKVNGVVKDAIDRVIEGAAKIDTTSKLAAAVDQAKQKVTETVTKAATSLITTAIKKTASLFSSLFKSLRK